MDLNLDDYDQMDEVKFSTNNNEQLFPDCCSPNLLVTLSSSSDQTSDDTNCENDFVFIPAPPKPTSESHKHAQFGSSSTQSQSHAARKPDLCTLGASRAEMDGRQLGQPLNAISNNGNNPFGNSRQSTSAESSNARQLFSTAREATSADKPIGILSVSPNIGGNPNNLADLMQQIVARSDLIFIAIPCVYCQQPVACPPSDISSWLNHMSKQHNCKLCPVCNKLVGLGPKRDVGIMKSHVLEHFDSEWLERRPLRATFTYGLQQQWFSGARCSVRESRGR